MAVSGHLGAEDRADGWVPACCYGNGKRRSSDGGDVNAPYTPDLCDECGATLSRPDRRLGLCPTCRAQAVEQAKQEATARRSGLDKFVEDLEGVGHGGGKPLTQHKMSIAPEMLNGAFHPQWR